MPAALASTLGSQGQRRRRGLGLSQRLARASRAVRERAARPAPQGDGTEPSEAAPSAEQAPRREPGGHRRTEQRQGGRRESASPARARAGRRGGEGDAEEEKGRRGRAPERSETEETPPPKPAPTPEQRARSAVEAFNASEERRKVAGLIRSLGSPQVSVRPDSGPVRVTVAWELSWYQWEIGGADGVREAGKGSEISELSAEAREWNATAGEDGSLRLGARPAAPEGEREPR